MTGRRSEVVVATQGRDKGKHYLITEMPSARSEKWAYKAFLLIRNSEERIPQNVTNLGMVGVAILGFNIWLRGKIDFKELEPLLDEMMECVKIVRDTRAVDKVTGGPVATDLVSDDDIAEPATRAWLRSEVLRVHTGFSLSEALSMLWSEIRASPSSNTPMSPPPSG